jgi:hypothetical protein
MTTQELVELLDWSKATRGYISGRVRFGHQCPIDAAGGNWNCAGGDLGLPNTDPIIGAADTTVNEYLDILDGLASPMSPRKGWEHRARLRMTFRLAMLGVEDPRPAEDRF